MKLSMKRYTVTINFIFNKTGNVKSIVENVKTLKEALSYKDILDETVSTARIKNNVTGRIKWLIPHTIK